MIDIQNPDYKPTPEEIFGYVRNPLLSEFCTKLSDCYKVSPKVEFSKCSFAYGWNIKLRKSSKGLCTIYPKENFFTVLVVISAKEKTEVEAILPRLSPEIQDIYHSTQEGNGQRWLMIDLEDGNEAYSDVLKLIDIRFKTK